METYSYQKMKYLFKAISATVVMKTFYATSLFAQTDSVFDVNKKLYKVWSHFDSTLYFDVNSKRMDACSVFTSFVTPPKSRTI
jgi:hypothetical protein